MAHPLSHQHTQQSSMPFIKSTVDIVEPMSVLDLVYNSPSPAASLLTSPNPSLDHIDTALSEFLKENTINSLLQNSDCVPSASLVQDIDNLFSMEVAQDIDLEMMIHSSCYESVLEELNLGSCPSIVDSAQFSSGFECDEGADCFNNIIPSSWQVLPVLSSYHVDDASDQVTSQPTVDMILESFLHPTSEESLTTENGTEAQLSLQESTHLSFPDQKDPFAELALSWLTAQIQEAPNSMMQGDTLEFPSPRAEGCVKYHVSECVRNSFSKKRKSCNEDGKALAVCGSRENRSRKNNCSSLAPCEESVQRYDTEYKSNTLHSGIQLQLVEKLVSCAQAVACHDNQQADLMLGQIKPLVSPYGDSLQRIGFFFAEGLRARLQAADSTTMPNSCLLQLSEKQRNEGFEAMYKGCPFVPFGHFATNSMILEAVEGEASIHILDLGMESGLQWLALIQSLEHRPSGHPGLVRITAVGASLEKMKAAGQQLEIVANSVKLRFEFRAVVVQSLDKLKNWMLDLREGEALVVNSVLQFHGLVKENRGAGLCPLLQLVREISPKILTVVEQDANHNGPLFLGRFKEALHYYSAIFESLDVTMPRASIERAKIEQFYLREQINNIVACEGAVRLERHERMDQWRRRMMRAGFQPFSFSLLTLKVRIWLARYDHCDEYSLTEEKGSLILGWRGKPILGATAWKR